VIGVLGGGLSGLALASRLPDSEVLEAADLVAQRRRGHVQLLGSPGEAQVPGGGLEGFQRVEGRQGAAHDRANFPHVSGEILSFVVRIPTT